MGTKNNWNDELEAALRKYHEAGLSHSLIARHVNEDCGSSFTRNAIIGKCVRLGLPVRSSTISLGGFQCRRPRPRTDADRDRSQTQRIRRNRTANVRRPPQFFAEEIDLPSPDHLGVKLFDLQAHHCRFIKDSTFCGQAVQADSSWCPFHHQLVYQRPTRPNLERLAGMKVLAA